MRKYALCLLTIVAMVSSFSLTFAHGYPDTYPPTPCPYPDSPHYNPNLAVTIQDDQLLLIDTSTNTVLHVLEDHILDFYHNLLYWSYNCRYFIANNIVQPNQKTYARFTDMYDVTTGARIFHTGEDRFFFLPYWSPSREQFIVKNVDGTFLMSEALNQPVFLFKHDYSGRSIRRIEWDKTHNQLLIIFAGNAGYLNIYDMNTGATLAAISNPKGCTPPVNYIASDDGHYLTVFTDMRRSGHPACLTVYNRDTGAQQSINADEFTASSPTQIALSPDGRYLVIGMLSLRVWDLANLPADFDDRLPIFRHEGPLVTIQKLRFVDATKVETTSTEGTQRWDILTGKLLE